MPKTGVLRSKKIVARDENWENRIQTSRRRSVARAYRAMPARYYDIIRRV